MNDAYIYDAVRTPRGKGKKDGTLHEVTSVRLSSVALNALKERNNLDGHAVEDVIWGNVTQVANKVPVWPVPPCFIPIWTSVFRVSRSTVSAPRVWKL